MKLNFNRSLITNMVMLSDPNPKTRSRLSQFAPTVNMLSVEAQPYAYQFDPVKTALVLSESVYLLGRTARELESRNQSTSNATSLNQADLARYKAFISMQSPKLLAPPLRF